MWTIKELKEKGKGSFKASYWPCVLAAFLLTLFAGGTAAASQSDGQGFEALWQNLRNLSPELLTTVIGVSAGVIVAGILVKVFLINPLKVGCYEFFVENNERPAKLGVIKNGFRNYGKVFITLFLRDLLLVFWTMLLIIPGVIKSYSYRMVPYILAENPELSPLECIRRSKEMMRGNKWNAFVLDLSFIGWHILTVLTFGLAGIFWTNPYKESTDAALYLCLS